MGHLANYSLAEETRKSQYRAWYYKKGEDSHAVVKPFEEEEEEPLLWRFGVTDVINITPKIYNNSYRHLA